MTVRDELAFGENAIQSKAHAALIRLLLKLELINSSHAQAKFHESDDFPIAYYGRANCFDEWEAIRKVGAQLKVPVFEITASNQSAVTHIFDNPPISHVDLSTWKKFRAIPVSVTDKTVTVCFANPLDLDAKSSLEFALQRNVTVAIGQERQIMGMIGAKHDGRDGLDFGSLVQASSALQIRQTPETQIGNFETNLTRDDIAAPAVIKLVNKILTTAIQQDASDLHISPEANYLAVRIRVDGITRQLLEIPADLRSPVISRLKVLCGMDIAEKRLPQDGRLRLKTNYGVRDLRASTVPTAHGEDFVARILSPELGAISFDSLGMPEVIQKPFEKSLSGSSKVHLCVGPTGSGKTSTLYAAVMYLKDGTSRIITIEDPIEYRLEGITQIQVNAKIEMTFAAALRSVLRQDPDTVLVGEIRDVETASTAMQVAQTGHLVLSTMHTNSAAASITRLKDLGVPSFLIASSVGSIMAQRLVRRLCPHCKIKDANASANKALTGLDTTKIYTSVGCNSCASSGYKGRIGVYSFLDVTPEIASAIRSDVSEIELEEIARQRGFQSLQESALALVSSGITSVEELERVLGPLGGHAAHLAINQDTVESEIKNVKIQVDELKEQQSIPKRKVLLVDDDENIRSVFHTLLEYEMFDVVEAENGLEGLKLIYESKPDVIICDLMMPKLGGLEMVERMRQDSRTKDIPVLMLTAIATEENELKLMKSGADDFISKTARADIIVARINRLMNR